MTEPVKVPRRRYRSPVREESARRTRRAIVDSATVLFTTDGYETTSLATIADAAGVARPTVTTAFGSKAALLAEVLDVALSGDDDSAPVVQREWFAPVWEAATPADALTAYATVCVLIAGRTAAVFEAVRRAGDSSLEVAELWESTQRNRRIGAAMVVERLASLGPLRQDLGIHRATDLLWTLNDPALYAALVNECEWPVSDYQRWLADTMRHQLLDPPPSVRGARGTTAGAS